jgi:hypothetical protein
MLTRLRQLRRAGQRGSVRVVIAGCTALILAAGAYTIDLGSGRQGQQRAQSAADAAALAAADAITISSPSTNQPAVTTTGVSVATDNLPGANVSVIMPTSTTAKVTVSSSSGNALGGLFGSKSLATSASATASLRTTTTTSGSVTSPANVAIFAADDTCADNSLSISGSLLGTGLLGGLLGGVLTPSNSLNINASAVISNGLEYFNTLNFPSNNSTFIYGGKNGCTYNGSTPTNSTRTQSRADFAFPEPYTQAQVPSDCIQEPSTFTFNIGNAGIPAGTYCASTSITIVGLISNLSLSGVSFVAPSITISSTIGSIQNWTPAANAPGGDLLAWATSGNLTVSLTALNNQINSITGNLYAPAGSINLTSNTINGTGLIEGNRVQIATQTMNYTGTGPATSTPGTAATTTVTGSSTLSQ